MRVVIAHISDTEDEYLERSASRNEIKVSEYIRRLIKRDMESVNEQESNTKAHGEQRDPRSDESEGHRTGQTGGDDRIHDYEPEPYAAERSPVEHPGSDTGDNTEIRP